MHLIVQTLYPEGGVMFQEDNAPIQTARLVTERSDAHYSKVDQLRWPALYKELNIIETLWGESLHRILVKNIL